MSAAPIDEALFRRAVVAGLGLQESAYRPDLSLGDVESWDSVGHLGLVSAIESAFSVRFPIEAIPTLTTLALFREAIETARAG